MLRRLARERLHDAHAGDVLRERRRDEPEPLAHARGTRASSVSGSSTVATAMSGRTTSVASASRQSRTKSITIEPTSDQRVLDERGDAVGDELVERLDVVRDPADDHAGAVALVEAEREPLQVAEEPVAQVGEDPLADPAGEVRLRASSRAGARARRRRRRRRSSRARSGRLRGCRGRRRACARSGGTSAASAARSERPRARAPCAACTASRAARASSTRRAVRATTSRSTSPPRCIGQVAAGLPDPHAATSSPLTGTASAPPRSSTRSANSRSSRPCSWISR